MEPSSELITRLRRDEIEDARRMTFAQKFWAGAELFDYACEVTRSGIRMQNPTMSEDEITRELRQRVARGASIHEVSR